MGDTGECDTPPGQAEPLIDTGANAQYPRPLRRARRPIDYDGADTAHIPKEVIDRFYGCGGPMSVAAVEPGETVVDFGSGAGIDVFIAANKVGPGFFALAVLKRPRAASPLSP